MQDNMVEPCYCYIFLTVPGDWTQDFMYGTKHFPTELYPQPSAAILASY